MKQSGPVAVHAEIGERLMTDLSKGDQVTWQSHGSTAHGKVEKKQTSATRIKGHAVKAAPDAPQYIVKSDNGGKAAHKRSALTKA